MLAEQAEGRDSVSNINWAGRAGVQGQPQLHETVLKEQKQEQKPDSDLLPVKTLQSES